MTDAAGADRVTGAASADRVTGAAGATGVVHLVADTLWHPELDRSPDHNESRDFR